MTRGRASYHKIVEYHDVAAKVLLNTIILFVVLNILAYLAIQVIQAVDKFSGNSNPIARKYGSETVRVVYPGMDPKEVDQILNETWSRPLVFEPYVQFKERPYRGRYVNVDGNGFRITGNQGPWPPDPNVVNIFLFGGSTAFGYGVSDEQTIASYLQEYLANRISRDIRVYNFGRGYYFSTQERILFEQLLTSGYIPDLGLFIDGLNEFKVGVENEPHYPGRLRAFVNRGFKEIKWGRGYSGIPIFRLTRIIKERLSTQGKNSQNGPDRLPGLDDSPQPGFRNDKEAMGVIQTYLNNKRVIEAVSEAYGTRAVFVWQPAPTYRHDNKTDPFAAEQGEHVLLRNGYQYLDEYRRRNVIGKNLIWCADIQEDLTGSLYIDKVHYSAEFSKVLASAIGDNLINSGYFEALDTSPTP